MKTFVLEMVGGPLDGRTVEYQGLPLEFYFPALNNRKPFISSEYEPPAVGFSKFRYVLRKDQEPQIELWRKATYDFAGEEE